ncbi:MAG: hypothetical protein ACYC8V_08625 [Caulobacteraceae bacterium]
MALWAKGTVWMAGAAAAAVLASAALAQEDWRDEGSALPAEMVAAAGAFEAYTERAASVSGAFADKEAVARGLRNGAPLEQNQFEEGMIAYGALAALSDGRFAQGVREAAREGGEGDLAERLARWPASVMEIDGAREAGARVRAALARRGEAVAGAGAAVKAAAYSIQHQAWSKERVADGAARLAELKALSASPVSASPEDQARVRASLADFAGDQSDEGEDSRFSPVVVDALALAAMAALGEARDGEGQEIQPLVSERASADCLRMARLNLFQCMAVAGPQYEDVFCLGQHALSDTGACVRAAAGGVSAQADPISAILARPPAESYRPPSRAWSPYGG